MALRKVIIDTDAGVDDAQALFLALAAHKDPNAPFEIIAITTVSGNTDVDHVNQNVFILLDSAGVNDIPVYQGAAKPLVQPFVRGENPFFGEDGFGDVDPSLLPVTRTARSLEKEFAPLALVRIVRDLKGDKSFKIPDKVTVMALGPLTNLAIAINVDPNFEKNVKDLFIMGGNIHAVGNIRPCSEFNFFVDPEAAFVVLASSWGESNLIVVPLETCKLAMSTLEWRLKVFGTIRSKQVKLLNLIEEKLLARYDKQYGKWVSADAVCMAVLLNPKIVKQQNTYYCTVELQGAYTRGQMVVDHAQRSGMEPNATVIEEIDRVQLEALFISTLSGKIFPQ